MSPPYPSESVTVMTYPDDFTALINRLRLQSSNRPFIPAADVTGSDRIQIRIALVMGIRDGFDMLKARNSNIYTSL